MHRFNYWSACKHSHAQHASTSNVWRCCATFQSPTAAQITNKRHLAKVCIRIGVHVVMLSFEYHQSKPHSCNATQKPACMIQLQFVCILSTTRTCLIECHRQHVNKGAALRMQHVVHKKGSPVDSLELLQLMNVEHNTLLHL